MRSMDYKYYFIIFLQRLVKLSNFLQIKILKNKNINLIGSEHLLILKLDRIGDSVWTVYFVKVLKEKFPNIKITVICNIYNRFVFDENKILFDKIISINDNPPWYIIKNFFKLFYVFDWIQTFLTNKKLWKNLRYKWFDYVLNFTGRKYFLVSKFLGKSVWNWLWIFNFVYDYPLVGHNEIWANKHIVYKWLEKLWINNENTNCQSTLSEFDNISCRLKTEGWIVKNALLFIWWKWPNKLTKDQYEKIYKSFEKLWIGIEIMSDDDMEKKYNFVLTKNNNWLYVKDKSLKQFIQDFDLFVWVDWWILHYVSQFIPTLSFYTSTNILAAYPFWWQIDVVENIWQWKIYICQGVKHCMVSKKLDCQWCFQVGCLLKKCWNFIDNEIEIIINRSIYALSCSN